MLLASCGTDIKFHKWPSGDNHGSFKISEIEFPIHSISWCCEGELLVTTSPSLISPIIISVGHTIQTHQVVHLTNVQTAAFSKTRQYIVAFGCKNGQVLLYDVNSQQKVENFVPKLPSEPKFIRYGARDSSIAVGCTNGQIGLYNSNHCICSSFYIPNSNNSLTTMSYHPTDPCLLGAGSEEGIVVVWDSNTGKTKFLNPANSNCITDMSFSSGAEFITVSFDQKLQLYDLRTNDCIYSFNANIPLSAVEFMPFGDQIAIASIDGILFCYDKRKMLNPTETIIASNLKTITQIAFQSLPTYKNSSFISIPSSTKMIYKTPTNPNAESMSTINSIVPASFPGYQNYQTPASGDYNAISDNLHISTTSSNYLNLRLNIGSAQNSNSITTGTTNVLNKLTIPHVRPSSPPPKSVAMIRRSSADQNKELEDFKKELQEFTQRTIEQLSELINHEFLNLRMTISKRFVHMEGNLNEKWKEFQATLMKLAGHDLEDEPNENEGKS